MELAEISDYSPDILKYEYMTQLLLDANYLPLVLKLFAHQDVDKAVDQKNDREDLEYVDKTATVPLTNQFPASSTSATSIQNTLQYLHPSPLSRPLPPATTKPPLHQSSSTAAAQLLNLHPQPHHSQPPAPKSTSSATPPLAPCRKLP